VAKSARTDEPDKMKALVHPRRQAIMGVILNRQADCPVSPREIANELGAGLSNVSYHVHVLADYEAIELKRTSPVRGSLQHFYAADPAFMALPWVKAALASFLPKAA
jgi:DNA-binding transcriptional regulator GbsR (MarR family)